MTVSTPVSKQGTRGASGVLVCCHMTTLNVFSPSWRDVFPLEVQDLQPTKPTEIWKVLLVWFVTLEKFSYLGWAGRTRLCSLAVWTWLCCLNFQIHDSSTVKWSQWYPGRWGCSADWMRSCIESASPRTWLVADTEQVRIPSLLRIRRKCGLLR